MQNYDNMKRSVPKNLLWKLDSPSIHPISKMYFRYLNENKHLEKYIVKHVGLINDLKFPKVYTFTKRG